MLVDISMLTVNAVIRVRGSRTPLRPKGVLPRMILVMASYCL